MRARYASSWPASSSTPTGVKGGASRLGLAVSGRWRRRFPAELMGAVQSASPPAAGGPGAGATRGRRRGRRAPGCHEPPPCRPLPAGISATSRLCCRCLWIFMCESSCASIPLPAMSSAARASSRTFSSPKAATAGHCSASARSRRAATAPSTRPRMAPSCRSSEWRPRHARPGGAPAAAAQPASSTRGGPASASPRPALACLPFRPTSARPPAGVPAPAAALQVPRDGRALSHGRPHLGGAHPRPGVCQGADREGVYVGSGAAGRVTGAEGLQHTRPCIAEGSSQAVQATGFAWASRRIGLDGPTLAGSSTPSSARHPPPAPLAPYRQLDAEKERYAQHARIKGLLASVVEELPDVPLYYRCGRGRTHNRMPPDGGRRRRGGPYLPLARASPACLTSTHAIQSCSAPPRRCPRACLGCVAITFFTLAPPVAAAPPPPLASSSPLQPP
jgi:hypothetical protein